MNIHALSLSLLLSFAAVPASLMAMERAAVSQAVLSQVIIEAAKAGNAQLLKDLLEENHALNIATIVDRNGSNPLHWACFNGHLACAAYLIEDKGADIYAVDGAGNHALYLATANNQLPIVQYLIEECGFDSAKPTLKGDTALDIALLKNNAEIIEYLCEAQTADQVNDDELDFDLAALAFAQENPARAIIPAANPAAAAKTVARESKCPICQSAAHEIRPAQIRATNCCRNFFCFDCYDTYRAQGQRTNCPICRTDNVMVEQAIMAR